MSAVTSPEGRWSGIPAPETEKSIILIPTVIYRAGLWVAHGNVHSPGTISTLLYNRENDINFPWDSSMPRYFIDYKIVKTV